VAAHPNWIMLGIQPNDCLKMEMQVKVPGLDLHTRAISLDATYRLFDRDDQFWRHSLDLDGADLQAY
jgi:glucose-6-phosphate 1-dehydrogenase